MKQRGCFYILLIILSIGLLTGCGLKEREQKGIVYKIYYINESDTKVISKDFLSETKDRDLLLQTFLSELAIPQIGTYKAVLNDLVSVSEYEIYENQLTLNLGEGFRTLEPIQAILTRAALVRTFCQIEGIKTVTITVNGEPIFDSAGNIIGPMTADMFIDNAGKEINAVENVKFTLYFADAEGQELIPITREVEFVSNISIEKVVVEQLILGPTDGDGVATINPSTKVISVTVNDGICYVNLSNDFLTSVGTISPELVIYSIVNSLVELNNVNKVQIAIDGETNLLFMEKMDLSVLYERDLDLIKKQ